MKYILPAFALAMFPAAAFAQSVTVNPGQWEMEQLELQIVNGDMVENRTSMSECWSLPAQTRINVSDMVPQGCVSGNIESDATGMTVEMTCNMEGVDMWGDYDIRIYGDGESMAWRLTLATYVEDTRFNDVITSNYVIAKRTGTCG